MDLFEFEDALDPSRGYFLDSVLALYLADRADDVFTIGRLRAVARGERFHAGDGSQVHVLLSGVLEADGQWQGPGCHFGEGDLSYTPRSDTALVWTMNRDVVTWQRDDAGELQGALNLALAAADRARAAAQPPDELPDPRTLCDVEHPLIQERARSLIRATEAATAEAIFLYVRAMPYRFGAWQEPASETLRQGWGMCTTKANLQVALMRAAGLAAGFVEVTIPMNVLGTLMPSAWLSLMRPNARHFFAAVRLNGRWHAADSSYNDDSLGIYIDAMPGLEHLRPAALSPGRPYNMAAAFRGVDPYDIAVTPNLHDDMGKSTRFAAEHFEALNTRLDRVQGSWQRWTQGSAPTKTTG